MSDMGVPVYLRSDNVDGRQFLGRFAAEDLAGLVVEIGEWGCFDGEDTYKPTFGQFFVSGTERVSAGFEIAVGNDE